MDNTVSQLDRLCKIVDELIETRQLEWIRTNKQLTVVVEKSALDIEKVRKQNISITHKNGLFHFSSVVLSLKNLPSSDSNLYQEVLFRTMRRNATKPIVSLGVDGYKRIVGRISFPETSASADLVAFYVKMLARECDRFEYVLSGEDTH